MKSIMKRMIEYIIKHSNTITDSIFFLVVVIAAFPFYKIFLNGLNTLGGLLTRAVDKGMSDTFELVFLCLFLYICIKIFAVILQAATYMQNQTKRLSNDIKRPTKKKN